MLNAQYVLGRRIVSVEQEKLKSSSTGTAVRSSPV